MKNKHNFTKALLATVMAIFSIAATATAQCVIPIAPGQSYNEDFESGEMECWTVETTGAATWAVMNGAGSNVVAFQNASADDEARLVSPTFDLSGSNSASLSFTYAMLALYPPYDELTVSYRTSPTDDWHELGSYSLSDWTNTYDEMFTLSDLSATFQVSFLGHCNGGYYIFIDDIEIASAGGCARPVNLQATEITAFSALLGWSTTGNEESWTIELNGENLIVNTQPYLLENLASGRDYTFRVKANCGGGMESEWSQPNSFRTLCDVIVVTDEEPYFDDFEASEEFVCWQSEILSGEDNWVIDPGYLILNNTAFFIWLGGEAMIHKIDANTKNGIYGVKFVLYDEGRNPLGEYTYACEDWETITLALPEASATYYIAFMGKSNEADGVYVDDVWVGNNPGVGVEEMPTLAATVSPNPTSGMVSIEANAAEGEVVVYDLFGRKVATTLLREGRAEIDLSDCAKGVYVARVYDTIGTTVVKLIKE